MVAARTVGTLLVIALFFAYIAAANIYLQMTYGQRAGPAVPVQETIRQITETVTQYAQIAVAIAIAIVAANMVMKSRKLLGVIPFKDVQRHLLLLGPTGAGKTSIAKRVIKMAIERSVRVTILDWKAGAGPLNIGRMRLSVCYSLSARPERGVRRFRRGRDDCQED